MEPIYVVLIINLIIWTGIFGFLVSTESKVNRLSKKLKELAAKK